MGQLYISHLVRFPDVRTRRSIRAPTSSDRPLMSDIDPGQKREALNISPEASNKFITLIGLLTPL
jgi:hypothetical protein